MNGRPSNKQIYWCRRSDQYGSHETKTTRHKVNNHKIKTRTTSQYYTTIRQDRRYARCNLCTNPRIEKQENKYGVYVSTATIRVHCKGPERKSPRMSNRGMKYICMFYIHDPNYIKGIPIKSRKKEELLRVYKEVYAYCESRGFRPQL